MKPEHFNARNAPVNPTQAAPEQGGADTAPAHGAAIGLNTIDNSGGGEGDNDENPTVSSATASHPAQSDALTGSQLHIGSGVDMAKAQRRAVVDDLARQPVEDTSNDEYVVDFLSIYIEGSEKRFKHMLTGMGNSTSEMLKNLKDAVTHLGDHIKQHKPSTEEKE